MRIMNTQQRMETVRIQSEQDGMRDNVILSISIRTQVIHYYSWNAHKISQSSKDVSTIITANVNPSKAQQCSRISDQYPQGVIMTQELRGLTNWQLYYYWQQKHKDQSYPCAKGLRASRRGKKRNAQIQIYIFGQGYFLAASIAQELTCSCTRGSRKKLTEAYVSVDSQQAPTPAQVHVGCSSSQRYFSKTASGRKVS